MTYWTPIRIAFTLAYAASFIALYLVI